MENPAAGSTTTPVVKPKEKKPSAPSPNPTKLANINVSIDVIPTYDGTTPIREFIELIEDSGYLANWSDAQKLAIAKIRLRGIAKHVLKSRPEAREDWAELKNALLTCFDVPKLPGERKHEFRNCYQKPNESVSIYATRLRALFNQELLEYVHLPSSEVDGINKKMHDDALEQFMIGLRPTISHQVIAAGPTNLEKAIIVAKQVEMAENLHKGINNRGQGIIRQVNYTNTNDNPNTKNEQNALLAVSKPWNQSRMNHDNGQNRLKNQNIQSQGRRHVSFNVDNRQINTSRGTNRANGYNNYRNNERNNGYRSNERNNNYRNNERNNARITDEMRCYACGRLGHLSRDCLSNRLNYQAAPNSSRRGAVRQ